MTQDEFDNLKVGDEVVITGQFNGSISVVSSKYIGQTIKICGKYQPGLPGQPGYWPGESLGGLIFCIVWPDEIDFPTRAVLTPKKIKCECGAAAIGIKLHTPGHSTWCPGR